MKYKLEGKDIPEFIITAHLSHQERMLEDGKYYDVKNILSSKKPQMLSRSEYPPYMSVYLSWPLA